MQFFTRTTQNRRKLKSPPLHHIYRPVRCKVEEKSHKTEENVAQKRNNQMAFLFGIANTTVVF